MYKQIDVPQRTIMTPGPVESHPLVQQAMSSRMLGQFDPYFLQMMDEVIELIKVPFHTKNEHAFAVDGTSRAGIEAALVALIEEGDKVLVPVYGRFAYLLVEIAERAGADVVMMEKDWDSPFDQEEIIAKIKEVNPKVVAMIHGETANGQLQDLDKIGNYLQTTDTLFVVDAVATYGGTAVKVDDWGIDIAIAGSQKCISVPSGIAMVTYNERVAKVLDERYQKELGLGGERNPERIQSNYLDLSQLQRYWTGDRINHHTEATAQVYGLHTGLRMLYEEGIENVYARHVLNDQAIVAGVKAMGLGIYGQESTKMPTVTPILIPEGIDGNAVHDFLLNTFGVEIAGSFGPLVGKIWRIGNMGYSSRRENVLQVLGAFEAALVYHGAEINQGAAVQAALKVYEDAGKLV